MGFPPLLQGRGANDATLPRTARDTRQSIEKRLKKTWTLPDHFPPNQYLRVKTDGGTLKQNGSALTWDGHGYYEISLDANSVTLSP